MTMEKKTHAPQQDSVKVYERNLCNHVLANPLTYLPGVLKTGLPEILSLSFFCSPSSTTRDTQMATRVTDGASCCPRWAS